MSRNKNDSSNWDSTNIRLGTNPVKLQQMDKDGILSPHLEVMDENIEYFQGKYHFTEKEITYYHDIFKFFDKGANEQLLTQDLGLALRSAGAVVTEKEVEMFSKKLDPYKKGYIEFNDFLLCFYQLSQKIHKGDYSKVIRESFECLDKEGTGLIHVKEMRHIMQNFGENLSEDELDAFMEYFTVHPNGTIRLEDIIEVLNFMPKMSTT